MAGRVAIRRFHTATRSIRAATASCQRWTTPVLRKANSLWPQPRHLACGLSLGAAAATLGVMQNRHASAEAAAKTKFRMGMCQIDVGADKEANILTAKLAVAEAAVQGAELVCLPECWNSPYATSSFPIYAEPVPNVGGTVDAHTSPSTAMLVEAAKSNKIYLVGGSIPERETAADGSEKIYNTSVTIDPTGAIIAKHRKVHLFDIDVPGKITFKESDTLTAGDGPTTFDTPFGKVGVAICYDIRFPELSMMMREQGCKMIIFPGAFNMTTGPAHWTLLQRARAVDQQVYVAAVSPARSKNKEDYQAWGHSSIISPWGDVVAEVSDEEQGQHVVVADLDFAAVDEFRSSVPTSLQKRFDIYAKASL